MTEARFTKLARSELLAQIVYYEGVREGLGARFRHEVEAAAGAAAALPLQGRPAAAGTRRRRVRGFPFAIFYTQVDGDVLIHAVAGDRQRPNYWAVRLGGSN